jgi:hypothetical protein
MFEKIKEIFKTKDNKPLTITAILGQDSCSRLLIEFGDNELMTTEKLLILKVDRSGGLSLFTSENLSTIETVGVLRLAEGMVKDEDC